MNKALTQSTFSIVFVLLILSFCLPACVSQPATTPPSIPDEPSAISTKGSEECEMRKMSIVWRRLVKNDQTCTRCEATGRELRAAVTKLRTALRPLGIEPVLEEQAMHEDIFKSNPSESNRVWIAGKSVEDWLGASVEMSHCGSVCGDSDCRTLKVDGRTYEMVPEQLFIKAGLIAAGQTMLPAAVSSEMTAAASCSSSGVTPCVPVSKKHRDECCDK